MKISKVQIAVLVLIVAVVCTAIIVVDLLRIKAELDKLYWIAENTHSGMVGMFIEEQEALFYQRLIFLLIPVGVIVLTVLSLTHMHKKNPVMCALMCAFLMSGLLTPTVSTMTLHYYARVEMNVPSSLYLLGVTGYITPKPAKFFDGWVCYSIGVGVPSSHEWMAAGYYTKKEGTVFYIEWRVDGVYNEITTSGVSFDVQYWIGVGVSYPTPPTAMACIYEDCTLILDKTNIELSENATRTNAGGESIYRCNFMSAEFSGLQWICYDVVNDEYLGGYWDGSEGFECTVIEHSPYSVNLIVPYYNFSVSGGSSGSGSGGNPLPPYHDIFNRRMQQVQNVKP